MSQSRLIEEVIKNGLCINCGACVGLCPYMDYFDGKVVVLDPCTYKEGRCSQFCPQIIDAPPDINRVSPIGKYIEVFASRATDGEIREKAQYGGTVSALLIHLLEKGFISYAVLTDKGNSHSPSGRWVKSKEEVLDCAGSRYSASGSLSRFNYLIKDKGPLKDICFVGLPCQIKALDKMSSKTDLSKILKIGLFCTWSLDYRSLREFLISKGIDGADGFDIPPPPLQVFRIYRKNSHIDIPLDEIRPLIQKGCSICMDMTSELSDISVGAMEGDEGWNTVIIRTEMGKELFDRALKEGIIEIKELPEKNLSHLKDSSLNKKKRGANNIKDLFS